MIFLRVRPDHILREKCPRDLKKPLEGANLYLMYVLLNTAPDHK